MLASFAHLISDMKVGNTSLGKMQTKLTTKFKNDFQIRFNFYTDQKHLSEEITMKETIEEFSEKAIVEKSVCRDIHVFDKGLKK